MRRLLLILELQDLVSEGLEEVCKFRTTEAFEVEPDASRALCVEADDPLASPLLTSAYELRRLRAGGRGRGFLLRLRRGDEA